MGFPPDCGSSLLLRGGGRTPLNSKHTNATFASADLLRIAKGGSYQDSKLNDFISDHISMPGASEKLKSIICSLGLSLSRGYMNLSPGQIRR